MLVAAHRLQSGLFAVGAAAITLAGCGKVLLKMLLAVWKKNVPWLNRYFVPCQIAGSCLALAALVLSLERIDWAGLVRFPRVVFWLLWLAGIGVMGWYRKHKFGQFPDRQLDGAAHQYRHPGRAADCHTAVSIFA